MSRLAYSKDFIQQTQSDHYWAMDGPGTYLCDNAFGSVPSSNWCTFVAMHNVKQFCMSDPSCIGFAYGQRNDYYQPTRIGFTWKGDLHLSSTFVKGFIPVNTTDLNILEQPNQYTCPNAFGVSLFSPLDQYCAFDSEEYARRYCAEDFQCLGFVCSQSYCTLTRYQFIYGTSSSDNSTSSLLGTRVQEIPPKQATSLNMAVYITIPILVVLIAICLYFYLERRKQSSNASIKPLFFNSMRSSSQSLRTRGGRHSTLSIERSLFSFSDVTNNATKNDSVYSYEMSNKISNSYCTITETPITPTNIKFCDPEEWTAKEVCSWLLEIGAPVKVIRNCRRLGISGKDLKGMLAPGDANSICAGETDFTSNVLRDKIMKLFGLI